MEDIKEKVAYDMAVERVKTIKKYYISISVFLLISIFFFGWNYYKTGGLDLSLGRYFILLVWALLLAIKGVRLFFFNTEWEKNMLNKELNKDKEDPYRRP